jgi:hypothetical protein
MIQNLNPSLKIVREATAQLVSLRNLRLQEHKAASQENYTAREIPTHPSRSAAVNRGS